MFENMRQHREGLIVKILLGGLALVFIFFFGSDTLRSMRSGGGMSSPAEVNGVPINARKAAMQIDAQLSEISKQMQGKIPEQYEGFIRQGVVNGLIRDELMRQGAQKLGLVTSASELKDNIRNNPDFQRNGAFDSKYYLNNFRVGYQRVYGSSYENDMRDEIAVQKITQEMRDLVEHDPELVKKRYQLENTQYKFSVIKVRTTAEPTDVLPKDLKADETAAQTATASQKELADTLWSKWRLGEKIDDLLSGNKLQIRATPELTPERLATVLDGKQDVDSLRQIARLTPEKPFPDSYFVQDGFYYLVKLDDLKKTTAEPAPEEFDKQANDVKDRWADAVLSAWLTELRDKAEIVYNMPEQPQ